MSDETNTKEAPEPANSGASAFQPIDYATLRKEKEASLRSRDAEIAKRRKARRDREFVEVVSPMLERDATLYAVEGKIESDTLPGWAVFRVPNSGECSRWKSIMWKDYRTKGADERKKEAGADMVRSCLKYPTAEQFAEMAENHGLFADECSNKVLAKAQALIDEEEKT